MMLSSILIAILSALLAYAREVSDCSCGFQDENTSSFYTDSIVLYFNETDTIDPAIFQAENFAHRKEQGWNSRYKIGAQSENVQVTNTTVHGSSVQALEMILDPTDKHHLVTGASLQSTRRDIQHGLFEAAMRPARQYTGGTVLTYGLHYNRSNGAGFDFMNGQTPDDAQVTNLVNGEWPASDLVTNMTVLDDAGLDPWNKFTPVSFSWNKSAVVFDIADYTTRLITRKDRTLPTAGQALQIKSWSMGDKNYGQGPPRNNATQSYVLYVRAFFNSSVMSESQHSAYDQRCDALPRCTTTDVSLRGYTAYNSTSESRWKEPPKNKGIRTLAGVVAACCSSFGIFALMNVFLRRTPWKKLWPKKAKSTAKISEESSPAPSFGERGKAAIAEKTLDNDASGSRSQTPLPQYGFESPRSGAHTPAPSYHTAAPSLRHMASLDSVATTDPFDQSTPPDVSTQSAVHRTNAFRLKSEGSKLDKALRRISEMSYIAKSDIEDLKSVETNDNSVEDLADVITPIHALPTIVDEQDPSADVAVAVTKDAGKQAIAVVKPVDDEKNSGKVLVVPVNPAEPITVRVDYLSGLTSVACLAVTLHHFGQTFWPFVIEGYGPTAHYPEAEHWLHIFVGGIILTNLWIGPFFLTATRFLSTNYLKHGNLEDIAKKELRRAPRLFVPIIIVSLLQYFLISMGLISSLQWLPSVTYSSWPFVSAQENFGVYLDNIVELAYMIPNAVPNITSHYCIGVLWTVPVQLQFTYVVLAATVVIRDVRNPWKRFGVYALVIVAGWYARSWSACHWGGLVLSDLEATYKWRNYLKTRPLARYAILTGASACALGATLFNVFNQKWSFTIAENSIHPEHATGKPLMYDTSVYPDYSEPTLAILLFSIGLQVVVELSTWVQAFLSLRFFVFLNPMIFCIYLTHGFVMWTWGAWVSLACNSAGMPYWANLLVTFVTTYVLIFALAYVLTPLLDFPAQALMRNLERWTKEEPKIKRPTTAPFSKALVIDRKIKESAAGEA